MRKFNVSCFVVCLVCMAGSILFWGCPAGNGASSDQSHLTIAFITHAGAGDIFWDVVQRGMEQAAIDLGITVNYQSNDDAPSQARLIDDAVASGADGIVVSMANPQALEQSIRNAVAVDIPVITINSGINFYKGFGALTHIGQSEFIAGAGAGERLASEGVTNLLCVIHEPANSGFEERCSGAAQSFEAADSVYVTGITDVSATQAEILSMLESNRNFDGVLTLNPIIATAAREAIAVSNSDAALATFDLNNDVIRSIENGSIIFAVDQQQYLQGYLPIVVLYLNIVNENTIGGGLPILTGPDFVDATNAGVVRDLATNGTR